MSRASSGSALEQGHAEAQTRLWLAAIEAVRAKLRALDEPADIRTRAEQELAAWVHPAAEQGHAEAQFTLGVMYATGQGVPQDDVEAV